MTQTTQDTQKVKNIKPTNIEKLKSSLFSNDFKTGLLVPILMGLQLLRHPLWYAKFILISILLIATLTIPYFNYFIFIPALYFFAHYAANHKLFSLKNVSPTTISDSHPKEPTTTNIEKNTKKEHKKNKQLNKNSSLSNIQLSKEKQDTLFTSASTPELISTLSPNPGNNSNQPHSIAKHQENEPEKIEHPSATIKPKRFISSFSNVKTDSLAYSFIFMVFIFTGALLFAVELLNKQVMNFIENKNDPNSFDVIAPFFLLMIFSAFSTALSFLVIFSTTLLSKAPKITDLFVACFEYILRNFLFFLSTTITLSFVFLFNILFFIISFYIGIANSSFETSVLIVSAISTITMFPLILYFFIFHAIKIHHQFFEAPFSAITKNDF